MAADRTSFAAEFVNAQPDEAARLLEIHAPQGVSAFVDRIPDPLSSKVLASMLPRPAAKCLEELPDQTVARYLAGLPAETVAAILRHMTRARVEAITPALPRILGFHVGLLLRYPRNTVGAWMTPAAPTLPEDCTVGEALRRLRDDDQHDQPEIYLLDDEKRLRSLVPLGTLIWSEPETPVSRLAVPVSYRLAASSALAAAADNAGWDVADRLPVVDGANQLVGMLRHLGLRAALSSEETPSPHSEQAASLGELELATLWYQGMAAALNAALARKDSSPQSATPD